MTFPGRPFSSARQHINLSPTFCLPETCGRRDQKTRHSGPLLHIQTPINTTPSIPLYSHSQPPPCPCLHPHRTHHLPRYTSTPLHTAPGSLVRSKSSSKSTLKNWVSSTPSRGIKRHRKRQPHRTVSYCCTTTRAEAAAFLLAYARLEKRGHGLIGVGGGKQADACSFRCCVISLKIGVVTQRLQARRVSVSQHFD